MISTAAMITDVAIDKFVMVRSDEHKALAAAHTLFVIRGALLSIILVLTAHSTADFFGVPQFSDSFALAGVIPFLQSFMNLGIIQVQRSYDYRPLALTLLFSQTAALIAVVVAAYVLRDHRAIIVSYVTEAVANCIASRLLSKHPYRIRPDRVELLKALSFGVPLIVNGVGLAVMSQFDRLLIGHWFGVNVLATYAVILSVAVVPINLIHRILGTLSLSYISSKANDDWTASDNYLALVFLWGVVATSYTLFVATTLDWLTPLIFGPNFNVGTVVHILIMVIAFCGVAKGAPMNLLLATGKTAKLSLLNLSSGLGLILSLILIHWWPRFEIALFGNAIGNLVSYALFVAISAASLGERGKPSLVDTAGAVGVSAIIILTFELRPELTFGARGFLFGVGLLAIIIQSAFGLYRHKTFTNLVLQHRT
jgi:O-antigen/teichoic acid export membrane protein